MDQERYRYVETEKDGSATALFADVATHLIHCYQDGQVLDSNETINPITRKLTTAMSVNGNPYIAIILLAPAVAFGHSAVDLKIFDLQSTHHGTVRKDITDKFPQLKMIAQQVGARR